MTWTDAEWQTREAEARAKALRGDARRAAVRFGRDVLRHYSTSFFVVTRFLPPLKRAEVDLVYAAVRYPDEIVDSFPLSASRRAAKLEHWRSEFERALEYHDMREALLDGVPLILAGFTQVMRDTGIPAAHYHAFLDAMQADIAPRAYASLDDLIDNYIYGSAVVVGYFLCHIYGATPGNFDRALQAARALGVALQLTNFIRDVREDDGRGRRYLPLDMHNPVPQLAARAREDYAFAAANLDAFAPDCRMAIDACIRVYGELNERVAAAGVSARQSVPMSRKFSVLPASKYWRLPLAYMGLETA